MSGSMHIVTLKETGHILAAFAVTTPSDDPDLAAIVGDELPLRRPREEGSTTPSTHSLVPIDVLELKSVSIDPAVIANPQNHAVDGDKVVALPPLGGAALSVSLTSIDVTLTGGAAKTTGLTVVARQGEPTIERRVQSGEFPVPPDPPPEEDPPDPPEPPELTVALAILPGESPASVTQGEEFDVLVAMAGHRPFWSRVTSS